MRPVWACICVLVVVLAVSFPWITGHPVSATPDPDTLPYCYLGMDTTQLQCVPRESRNYVYCSVRKTDRCRCSEGLVCKRDSTYDETVTEPQCVFTCVHANPELLGRKPPQDYNQNMERT